ncbi:MAG: histidinol-phosphate aminotransferase family protein [Methanophagales archaeon ANME-1-THS]|nr:MAG: histidinol-phosphate aminotransferase family protein [Methanophagales archaeon ANME-1-THS]
MVKPRVALAGLKVCEHGGERLKNKNGPIIDFSVSLNPYGPPDFIANAIQEAVEELSIYPETECSELRALIARKYNREENEILVAAGSSELIPLVTLTFVNQRVIIPEHTYGEYETAARMMGAHIEYVEMPALQITPELIVEEMRTDDVVFLCNPNNPTGQYLGKPEIELMVDEAERVDALLVLDEAYVDFVRGAFPSTELRSPNLIILRSLTKSFAIPGVRIGYAIAAADLITEMRKIKVPWSVSVFAQKIGAAVLGSKGDEFLGHTREKLERSKRRIEDAWGIHSDANYYILDVGSGTEVKSALLKERIMVRDCTSFGLPSSIRFSVKRDEENELLIRHLMRFFSSKNTQPE